MTRQVQCNNVKRDRRGIPVVRLAAMSLDPSSGGLKGGHQGQSQPLGTKAISRACNQRVGHPGFRARENEPRVFVTNWIQLF